MPFYSLLHAPTTCNVQAYVPLAEMFSYVSTLRGMTKGRANYSMCLERYEVVPPNIQVCDLNCVVIVL